MKVNRRPIEVVLEVGKKKAFASAADWPGWSRGGRDESTALGKLFNYGPRYARVLEGTNLAFQLPAELQDLVIARRHEGNATTDFGAPAIISNYDHREMTHEDYDEAIRLLQACWRAFDQAVDGAKGVELQKGPRGGGRDLGKIIDHVIDGDRSYLSRLAWKHRRDTELAPDEELARTREAILGSLVIAENGQLPETGPRGGLIWPPRYFIRRVAWHVLDHAWEIEDRS